MTLEEILSLEDVDQKIEYLKKGRKTEEPNTGENWKDWNADLHEIIVDKETYPDIEVVEEKEREEWNDSTGKSTTIPAKKRTEPCNRISIPLEQDITNIQTAFTVGVEPKMDCVPSNEDENGLFYAIQQVLKKNKIKYQNKRIVRSWLSEQECAEYWYAVKDDSFWTKFWNKIQRAFGGSVRPQNKLRSVIWSPFRGDKLYPFFDDAGDLVAFSREYKKKDLDDVEIVCFQTVTATHVYQWENTNGWEAVEEKSFRHGFKKLPVLYGYRPETYCHKIKTIRVRIEKILSSYADCIDYHFFPYLMLFGDVSGFTGKKRNRIIQLTGDKANAQYLTWNQVPDTVKLELEGLTNRAYDLTNTPRISPQELKGLGNAISGKAFRYIFMGAHMAVSNHAEVIGEFFQRRVNFLVSALADINPSEFDKASQTIDIDVDLAPYMIDDIDERVATAVSAIEGKVWSRREGILFAGNAERVDEVLKEIEEEEKSEVSISSESVKKNRNESV